MNACTAVLTGVVAAFVACTIVCDAVSALADQLRRIADRVIQYAQTRPCVRIHERGDLYLERYYLFGRKANKGIPAEAVRLRWLPTVWVHRFVRPDSGVAQHNHPWWWAFSIVLRGAYVEERGRRRRLIKHVNFITRTTFHRVARLDGDVWTLFTTGGHAGSWGFISGGRVVPWREFVAKRDEQSTTTNRP